MDISLEGIFAGRLSPLLILECELRLLDDRLWVRAFQSIQSNPPISS
jgi:hypothetical protein